MSVPAFDLKEQYKQLRSEIEPLVREVFESQYFILGPNVEALEKEIADYCGCRHAIGVASGSDAITLALHAAGVGPGDEVITTTYTFFATAGCIWRLGAKPVLVDILDDTMQIDVSQIEPKITGATKAIIPVHLFGQCVDMDPILALASKHNLAVIEDTAQAIGARYRGRCAGTMGDAGALSFYPTKNLGGAGDGGMVLTNDPDLEARVRMLRDHGQKPRYYHSTVGYNSRLDALQAVVLRAKLKHLDDWNARRASHAAFYDETFSGSSIRVPARVDWSTHTYHQYSIRVEDRDALAEHLKANEVGCAFYYPVPLHLQECFKELGYKEGDLPVAEAAAKTSLALPIYPELTAEQLACVAEAVLSFTG